MNNLDKIIKAIKRKHKLKYWPIGTFVKFKKPEIFGTDILAPGSFLADTTAEIYIPKDLIKHGSRKLVENKAEIIEIIKTSKGIVYIINFKSTRTSNTTGLYETQLGYLAQDLETY